MCTRSLLSNGKRVYSERTFILGLKKLPSHWQVGQRTTAFTKAACCSTLLPHWGGPHGLLRVDLPRPWSVSISAAECTGHSYAGPGRKDCREAACPYSLAANSFPLRRRAAGERGVKTHSATWIKPRS